MKWFLDFLTSSIGRKLVMSLTGLFLITFLPVHLAGNLQLLAGDGGEAFNIYAKFMTSNPLIKFTSYGLYTGIALHAILGLAIWAKNRSATGKSYAVKNGNGTTWASRSMAFLGTLILIFIFIHMGDFWYSMKFGGLDDKLVTYDGIKYKDLYTKVSTSFSQLWIVIVYVISMIALAFHLNHGFASAFQSLGLNHKKYTPLIKGLGTVYSIIIPLMFALIPILMMFGIDVPALNFMHN